MTGAPAVIVAPGRGASGIRLTPNQILPPQRRWRVSVTSGSLPFTAVSGSIVVNTQRSQHLATRKVTSPMRSLRQPSSAHAGAPVTTTLGRNLVIGSGPSAASGPSRIQSFSAASDSDAVSSSG